MKSLHIIICIVIFSVIAACSPEPRTQRSIVAIDQPQVIEFTPIIGKTTRKDIIDAFGMPPDLSSDVNAGIGYRPEKMVFILHLTDDSGEKWNVKVGKEKYGCDYGYIGFSLKDGVIVRYFVSK